MKFRSKNSINQQKKIFNVTPKDDINSRIERLRILKQAIIDNEVLMVEALKEDLNKSYFEGYTAEIAAVIKEINYAIKNVRKWSKVKKVRGGVVNFPSRGYIYKEPYGVVLIFGAWNYPFQLTLIPLVGALAAGNNVVLKPSEVSSRSSKVLKKVLDEAFKGIHVEVFEGGVEASEALLDCSFDKIFFTGSPSVGKKVMQKAAERLIPVTLELGGKSPCIVDEDVNLDVAVKRIAWGKFMNVGQTCVAPDYVILHENIKDDFYRKFKEVIIDFYGDDIKSSEDYGRIVNDAHFERIVSLIENNKIVVGGSFNKQELFIEPTILEIDNLNVKIMKEEIFGPLLPVITYNNYSEIIKIVKHNPNPLALYTFSNNRKFTTQINHDIPFGGGCINDTISHFLPNNLPFGGRGVSGVGNYHGKYSFYTFSHTKSILKKSNLIDFNSKYPPYNKKVKNFIKKILKKKHS